MTEVFSVGLGAMDACGTFMLILMGIGVFLLVASIIGAIGDAMRKK